MHKAVEQKEDALSLSHCCLQLEFVPFLVEGGCAVWKKKKDKCSEMWTDEIMLQRRSRYGWNSPSVTYRERCETGLVLKPP